MIKNYELWTELQSSTGKILPVEDCSSGSRKLVV